MTIELANNQSAELSPAELHIVQQQKMTNFFTELQVCLQSAEKNGIPPDAIYMQLAFWAHAFMTGIVTGATTNTNGLTKQ